MPISAFAAAINQLSDERGLPKEVIVEAIESAVAAAYRKDYGDPDQNIISKLDEEDGQFRIFQSFEVVEEPENVHSQLTVEEAEQFLKDDKGAKVVAAEGKKTAKVELGAQITTELEPHSDFGRIAAQTAKQVISQRLREAEKEILFAEYKEKQGQLINGYVQQVEGPNVIINIGKLNGLMIASDQIPNQAYYPGQRLKVLVYNVEETPKGPRVLVTRSNGDFISKLFELEVPEIASGSVEVKAISREAGTRTKMAVISTQAGLDPVGSCVGQRGTRVQAVLSEIGEEKIDIIPWKENIEQYIAEALKPAKIEKIILKKKLQRAEVVVPEDQLSLAIGKNGQNVRLASKLAGWEIDILKVGEKPQKVEEPVAAAEDEEAKE
ncbi:MAG TPA: transcription termination factor NusA [Candidatus Saccharimonadales bacterium]|nr:transcription termination factor NusA [Candidatus Saccharimonadales bacterium]